MNNLTSTPTINVLAAPTVRASLILKHGSSSDWLLANPILQAGELGIELDTGLMKVGDGSSNYKDLDYINISSNKVEEIVEEKIGDTLSSYIQKPENFTNGNLPMFNESGNLVDSGTSIEEYTEGGIASEDTPGRVVSSSEDNAISVDENGKMSVNRLSVSNLFVPDDDELILSAGGAND